MTIATLHRTMWLLLVSLLLLLNSCTEEKASLKIGYVGGLTGRVAGLGVTGRDAVILAVEQRNRQGGIDGRPIELIVRDDKQDAATAKQAVRELIDAGVVAIIGPMTSAMSVVSQPLIEAAGVVMISPTAKTDQLSRLDDHFFRVIPRLSINAEHLAAYVTSEHGLKRFSILYDINNRAFTENWLSSFRASLEGRGGEVTQAESFASSPATGFLALAERIVEHNPEGLLIVANAMDTAMTAQQLRKLGSDLPIFTAEWSFTSDVINFGGHAVEGMTAFLTFDAESDKPRYLAFRDQFEARFGYPPSFATVLSYDAGQLLLKGLEVNPRRAGLKDALLDLGHFEGLQSGLLLDRYGDIERRLFLTEIRDGQFVVVEQH